MLSGCEVLQIPPLSPPHPLYLSHCPYPLRDHYHDLCPPHALQCTWLAGILRARLLPSEEEEEGGHSECSQEGQGGQGGQVTKPPRILATIDTLSLYFRLRLWLEIGLRLWLGLGLITKLHYYLYLIQGAISSFFFYSRYEFV